MLNEKGVNSLPAVVNYYALTKTVLLVTLLSTPFAFIGSKGWYSFWIVLLIFIGLPAFFIVYLGNRNTHFSMNDGKITIDSGIITKKSKTILLNNIQNVGLERGLLMRMFGISKVKIWTASQSQISSDKNGSSAKPDGLLFLNQIDADWLNEYLTRKT